MKKIIIETWKIFWKYSVVQELNKQWKDRVFLCKCECWVNKSVRLRHLISWAIKSCWKCSEFLDKECKQCWIIMHIPFHNRKRIFCSMECKVKSTITKEIISCINCWKDVIKHKNRKDKKFCSLSCRSIYSQSVFHNIDIEEYKIVRVEINKELLKKRKSTEYKKKMKEAMERDLFKCQDCWANAECVHHIKQVKDYPELILELDNLKSLCNNCHKKIHGKNKD